MKKCWFFGDSFTRGDNCHKGDPYYELTYKEGCKRWTTIVSEKLNYKEINTAAGGMSNMAIITQIITNMSKMKKDDYAIITNTLPHRTLAFKDNGDFINIINDIISKRENNIKTYIFNWKGNKNNNHELEG